MTKETKVPPKTIVYVALIAKILILALYLRQIWLDYFTPPLPDAAEPLGLLALTGLFLFFLSLTFVLEYRFKMKFAGTLPQKSYKQPPHKGKKRH